MTTPSQHRWTVHLVLAGLLITAGCTTSIVKDPERRVLADAAHCSGSETVNDSSVAVLPIPVVAFFVPHADVNDVQAEAYLRRCGEPSKLRNRRVAVSRTACIPAGLTRIITLGVWQWCPANVSWEADVNP